MTLQILPGFEIFTLDLLAFFGAYLILAVSLNLEYGYAGVPNFGKVLLFAGGAYVVGSVAGRLGQLLTGVSLKLDFIKDNAEVVNSANLVLAQNPALSITIFLVTLALAGAVGAALSFLASYPAIRLREDYLGVSLLAIGEISRVVGINYHDLVGGTLGVQVPDPFAWSGDIRFGIATAALLILGILSLLYAERLARSPLGRMLRAIRDNEQAAHALGKDITHVRMKILIVGSILSALGGGMYAFYTGGVFAGTYERVEWTFWPWLMLIVGGAANNIGAAAGAFIFVIARKLIIFYKDAFAAYLPFDVIWLELILLGGTMILVLMFRPQGVFPEKPSSTLGFKQLEKYVQRITTSGPPMARAGPPNTHPPSREPPRQPRP